MRLGLNIGISRRRGGSGSAPAPFSPASLFGGGVKGAYFDISDLSTLFEERTGAAATTAASVDGVVGTVLDLSGNDNHITAPSDAARPILRQAGDLYYLDFDGSDDELRFSGGALDMARNVSAMTLAAAQSFDANPSADTTIIFISTGTNGISSRCLLRAINGNLLQFGGRRLDGDSAAVQTLASAGTGVNVLVSRFDYANAAAYLVRNRTDTATLDPFKTAGATSDTASLAASIGANNGQQYLNGRIYAAVIYDGLATGDTLADIEDWLAAKSGVTL